MREAREIADRIANLSFSAGGRSYAEDRVNCEYSQGRVGVPELAEQAALAAN